MFINENEYKKQLSYYHEFMMIPRLIMFHVIIEILQ